LNVIKNRMLIFQLKVEFLNLLFASLTWCPRKESNLHTLITKQDLYH
jgi:hypothetical protein